MTTAESQSNHTIEVDAIETARNTQDGTSYVSIRRVCDNLGIDSDSQLKKVKGYHWARSVNITVRDQLS